MIVKKNYCTALSYQTGQLILFITFPKLFHFYISIMAFVYICLLLYSLYNYPHSTGLSKLNNIANYFFYSRFHPCIFD